MRAAWLIVAAAGLVAYLAHAVDLVPGYDRLFDRAVYGGLFALAIAALCIRVLRVREERNAWALLAAGAAANLAGWGAYWAFVQDDPAAGFPSVADAGWLAGYTFNYVGLLLLFRSRAPRLDRTLWLDGAIGFLALAALSAAVVYDAVLGSTGASTTAVLTNLAYPTADLAVLGTLVTVFALSGWRPGRALLVLGAAFSVQVVADSIYLYESSTGEWVQGTLLDAAWPLQTLLVAMVAWMAPGGRREHSPEAWRLLVVPGLFAVTAVGVLVYGSFADVPRGAAVLATGALVVVALRTVVFFRQMLELSERHARAVDASLTDHLTGLRNHRAFHEDLTRMLGRAKAGDSVALLMIDLVGLKATNDNLGHQAGDERLKRLAARLGRLLRSGDAAYRVGGDEFAVSLENLSSWDAFNLAERLQREVSGGFATVAPEVSVGVADCERGTAKDELIRRADIALREAKRSHRKAVLYSSDIDLPEAPEPSREHTKTLATALARAVDAKDSYTRSHCETVSESCVLIAGELGLEPQRVAKLRLAGLLHDVGKIGIPDTILQKPARLTEAEFETMKTHSRLGHSIVSATGLWDEADWVLHHHERPDGNGYPDGLAGDAVPFESRIILVADAFEAITSDRPYRKGRSDEEALAELRRHAGTQFDPACVEALAAALKIAEAATSS